MDSISNSDGQWLSSRTQGSKSLIVVDVVVPVCSVVAVYFIKSCRYIEIKFNQCFVECFAMVILFVLESSSVPRVDQWKNQVCHWHQ